MSTLEKHFQQAPVEAAGNQADPLREIVVIYTTPAATAAALRRAAILCQGQFTRIRLVAITVVPYPLAVSTPAVAPDFTEHCLEELVSGIDVQVRIDMVNCRDDMDALCTALQQRSMVLIGPRLHWWSMHEARLTKALVRLGHTVLLLDERQGK